MSIIRFDHSGRNKTIVWNDGSTRPVNTPFDEPFSFQRGKVAEFTQAMVRPVELRGVLDVGGTRGSTLLVRVENVVLRLHGHMACVSAV